LWLFSPTNLLSLTLSDMALAGCAPANSGGSWELCFKKEFGLLDNFEENSHTFSQKLLLGHKWQLVYKFCKIFFEKHNFLCRILKLSLYNSVFFGDCQNFLVTKIGSIYFQYVKNHARLRSADVSKITRFKENIWVFVQVPRKVRIICRSGA
jgi:hypothetical protein